MKKLLIIAFSDLENDPRVYRQIHYFSQFYQVTAIGWDPIHIDSVRFIPIKHTSRTIFQRILRAFQYKLHRFETIYWSIYHYQEVMDLLENESFDIIIANDLDTLPFALKIAKNAKVVLDTHEYAPRHFENVWSWRFFFQEFNKYLCKTYMNRCDAIITVSQGVADEYKKNYDIDPVVITNAADYVELEPGPVNDSNIKIISHGISNPSRNLELLIETADYLDERFHLDLMLIPTFPRYYKKLQDMAAKRKNVRIIPAVPRKEIISTIHAYDLSLLVFKPTTINIRYGLFNRFFESLQARLGIVTGPLQYSHVDIIDKYSCGLITQNYTPADIAKQLNHLTSGDIMKYKEHACIAARVFTAQNEIEKMGELVKNLFKEGT